MDKSTFAAATDAHTLLKDSVRQNLQDRGQALNLRSIDLTDRALVMDGALIQLSAGRSNYVASIDNTDPSIFLEYRLDVIGLYTNINGIAYWVNEEGVAHAGYISHEELQEAGYANQESSIGLPNLYGTDGFSEPDTRAEWDRIQTLQGLADIAANKAKFLAECAKRAVNITVDTADLTANGQRFMKLDGLYWRSEHDGSRGRYVTTDRCVDSTQVERYQKVGFYYTYGALLVFVDQDGHLFAGHNSEDHCNLLENAGYGRVHRWDNDAIPFLIPPNGCIVGYTNHYEPDEAVIRRFANMIHFDPEEYLAAAENIVSPAGALPTTVPDPA